MIWTQYFRLIMIWRVTWNMNKSSHFRTRIATRRGGMASGIALQRGTLESKIVYRRVAADLENRKYIWLTKFSVRFLPNLLEVGPLPRYSWLDPELRNLFPFLPPLCLFNVHLSLLIRQVPHSSSSSFVTPYSSLLCGSADWYGISRSILDSRRWLPLIQSPDSDSLPTGLLKVKRRTAPFFL